MPTIVEITLESHVGSAIEPEWVHAVAARWLDGHTGATKPYAVSLPFTTTGGQLGFRLRLLDDRLIELCELAASKAVQDGVRLGPTTHPFHSIEVLARQTVMELAVNAVESRLHTFIFHTPTFFRSGDRTSPLPMPLNIFRSLQQSWTAAAKAIDMTHQEVRIPPLQITDLNVKSARLPHHRREWIGFVGSVTIEIDRGTPGEIAQALHAFAHLSPYSGVGAQTQFGAGEVSVSSR